MRRRGDGRRDAASVGRGVAVDRHHPRYDHDDDGGAAPALRGIDIRRTGDVMGR